MRSSVILLLGLAACTSSPKEAPRDSAIVTQSAVAKAPAAEWRITEGKSPMDDSPTVVLSRFATEPVRSRTDSLLPSLVIRCKEGKTDVYVVTESAAQPEMGKYEEYSVTLRLDANRPVEEDWSAATDDQALFSPSPVSFARRLSSSDTFRIRFTPFSASPVVATFALAGLAQHIERVSTACDWTGARLPKTTDPRRLARNREAMLPFVRQYVVVENWSVDGTTTPVLMAVDDHAVIFNATTIPFNRIDSTRMQDGALIVVIKKR